MTFEDNLAKLKIVLPEPKDPVGAYIAVKKIDQFLYVSGQISTDEKGNLIKGKIGSRKPHAITRNTTFVPFESKDRFGTNLILSNVGSLLSVQFSSVFSMNYPN